MSKLGINTGSSPNAGDGDSLLSGAIKINSNFNELYTALGDGSTLSNPVTSIVAGTNVSVSSSTGDVTINATASGGGGGVDIQDEGVALATTATTLNFVGNGVVASGTGTTKTITISGGGSGGAGIDVQDEGVALATTATTLNFVGGGVVASGTGATKTITINTGAGATVTTVYVAESIDDNVGYNIPFLTTAGAGGGQRGFQVDNAGFGFNPSLNILYVNNISSVPASTVDLTLTGMGATSKGIGYFKFTSAGAAVNQLLLGNVAIGYSAGSKSANPATSSSNMRNVFVGSLAGLNQTSGGFNVYVGFNAAATNIHGDQNVAIGYNAGDGNISGSNNTYLGQGATATSSSTSNEVVIGNSGVNKFRIPGIGVTFKDNGGRPGTGHVLTADENGEASFAAISNPQGITNSSTISNLSSSTDVMVGVAVGPRFHASYDSSNESILISTGDASGGRNYGTMKWRTGRESGGTSIYGNNSGASINIAHHDGKMLLCNKSGNFNIQSSGHDGFKFLLDGTMVNASESGAGANMSLARRDSGNAMEFKHNTAVRGSIYIDTSANTTTYNTTSDYRTKENVVGITSALDKINQLRPVNFNMIGCTVKLDGFLAHEVQAVVPYAVTGEKDAVMTVMDGDLSDTGTKEDADRIAGFSTTTIPDYQQLDYSKLVTLLTASIQELSAKNDALEARIKTLEG